jgi:hypothetical protein
MTEYLTKPLDKKLLLSMVHKCATTTPVLHPSFIEELTPETEYSNPMDSHDIRDRESESTKQRGHEHESRIHNLLHRAATNPA